MSTNIVVTDQMQIIAAPTGGLPLDPLTPWLNSKRSERTRKLYKPIF